MKKAPGGVKGCEPFTGRTGLVIDTPLDRPRGVGCCAGSQEEKLIWKLRGEFSGLPGLGEL